MSNKAFSYASRSRLAMPEEHSWEIPVPTVLSSALLPEALQEQLPTCVLDAVTWGCEKEGLRVSPEEIRLRAHRKASLTLGGKNVLLPLSLTSAELFTILTRMCNGSLYSYSQNISEGFITLPGGIRVGVVGEAACEDGRVVGVRDISSLCIRIPHIRLNVGRGLAQRFKRDCRKNGSPRGLLIYAPPGVGKTTLLKGMIFELAGGGDPLRTVVIDTRGELTYPTGGEALCLDVLTGYPRALGVGIATRSMNAQVIVCDEIGERREALSLISAYHGGVPLVASAHAASLKELLRHPGIQLLHKAEIFAAYVGIRRDGRGGFVEQITSWEEANHAI